MNKYIQQRLQTKEKIEQIQVQMDAEEISLQLQSDILSTQRELAKVKSEYQASLYPENPSQWDSNKIVNLQKRIETLEDALIRLQKLLKELFGEIAE